MARRLQLNEWWPFLLLMQKKIMQYGRNPRRAASEVVTECGREMPGHGSAQSKVKMLPRNRHRDHCDQLKAELGPVPRTVELTIAMTSPQKATLASRWFKNLFLSSKIP